MKDISWTYLAGITDSDGHISSGENIWQVTNVDKELIGSIFFFLRRQRISPHVWCVDNSERDDSLSEKMTWYLKTSPKDTKEVLENLVHKLEHPEKKEEAEKILVELEGANFNRSPFKIQFSDSEKKEIINRYKNGETLKKIADDFHCSGSTISDRLVKWGEKTGTSGKGKEIRFSTEEKEDIISRYENDETFASIAEDYPYSITTIRNRLENWGVHDSRQVSFSEKEKKEIIKRYELGQAIKSIAKNFDCSAPTVRNRLESWGIELDSSRSGRNKEEDLEAQLKFEEISDEF